MPQPTNCKHQLHIGDKKLEKKCFVLNPLCILYIPPCVVGGPVPTVPRDLKALLTLLAVRQGSHHHLVSAVCGHYNTWWNIQEDPWD